MVGQVWPLQLFTLNLSILHQNFVQYSSLLLKEALHTHTMLVVLVFVLLVVLYLQCVLGRSSNLQAQVLQESDSDRSEAHLTLRQWHWDPDATREAWQSSWSSFNSGRGAHCLQWQTRERKESEYFFPCLCYLSPFLLHLMLMPAGVQWRCLWAGSPVQWLCSEADKTVSGTFLKLLWCKLLQGAERCVTEVVKRANVIRMKKLFNLCSLLPQESTDICWGLVE